MAARYNPVSGLLLLVGGLLARAGLVERDRVARATELAWPRIVTGLARMSKSTADVAMVGLALGPSAIAGVGFATPFWELAFAIGAGIAGATIGMVSQRYGADAREELGLTVTTSAAVVLAITLPLAAAYWLLPDLLVDLVGSDAAAVGYGAQYLRVVALGVPFAALNLVGSRTLVGADDAYAPMVLRAGGAAINIALNAALIFGLGMGVVGAAIGTVVANVVITVGFAVGLVRGGLPGLDFPVQIGLSRPFLDRRLARDLASMGAPLVGTNLARTGAQFPRLFIVGLFGPGVVSAYVVALRVRALLDTPNWGLSLASSSLVGQALGESDEGEATVWARTVLRLGIGVYVVVALSVLPLSRQVGRLFVDDPAVLGLVATFVAVACVSVVFRGVDGGATGPLRASGDTRWPFYSQLLGMYVFALPVAAVGVLLPTVGVLALYASLLVETAVPAAVTYHRFRSGTWRVVSRAYRPDAALDD